MGLVLQVIKALDTSYAALSRDLYHGKSYEPQSYCLGIHTSLWASVYIKKIQAGQLFHGISVA